MLLWSDSQQAELQSEPRPMIFQVQPGQILHASQAVSEAVAVQVESIRGLARVGVCSEVDPQGADEVAIVLAVVGFDASDQLPEWL